jgi:proteasome-associated ATPase
VPEKEQEVMPQAAENRQDAELRDLKKLVVLDNGSPNLEHRIEMAQLLRGRSRERSRQVDHFLIGSVLRHARGLAEARRQIEALKELVDKVLAPPWHAALFLRLVTPGGGGPRALVIHGNAQRLVNVAEEIDAGALMPGEEVYLGKELNLIVGRSPTGIPPCGETAVFERWTSGDRIVLKSRDERVVVNAAHPLLQTALKTGDLVRWDRTFLFAFEKIEPGDGGHLFLEDTPRDTFAAIGGLARQIQQLQRILALHVLHGETARRYRMRRRGSVLLVGRPGTGKTMIARAVANWLAAQSPSGRARFLDIKPASLHSSWYGQSEANYREAFRIARTAGDAEPGIPVVMFFDEVDAVGAVRGHSVTRVDDRVLTAFMTELDGLQSRGNVLVLAATNRRDAIDPALLRPGRLGDVVIEVPRPDMRAAREIFGKYLRADLPYAGDGDAAREAVLDAVVSRLYAPNGAGDGAVGKLRDGKQRAVKAAELLSGADIAKIADAAVEAACVREIETGDAGLRSLDVVAAAEDHVESLARGLTPATCRGHLENLPNDVDVVAVEPTAGKGVRLSRYVDLGAPRRGGGRS